MKKAEEKQAVFGRLKEKSGTLTAAMEELPEEIRVNEEKYEKLDVETAQVLNAMAEAYENGEKEQALAMGLENSVLLLVPPVRQKSRSVQVPLRAKGLKRLFQNFSEACARLRCDPEQQRIDRERGLQAFRELQATAQEIKRREEAGKG